MDKKFLDVALEVKASDIKEDGTFKGHGSLFDKIPDSYGDIINRGAFSETLAQGGRNRTGIPMLWQHNTSQIPGVWLSLAEDKKGLPVEGQLALKTTLGNDVYEIMKLGAESGTFKLGLSIGYDAKDFEYITPKDSDRKIRILKKVELWEISLVTFPAKIGAMVSTVKMIEDAKTERELEKALREAGNLSKSAAQYIVKLCRPSLREANTVVGNGGLLTILDGLKQINQNLLFPDEDRGIGGNRSLPTDDRIAWDATAAVNRVRKWAGGPSKDDINFAKYKQAFVWFNSSDPNVFGSYKLPFADVIGGTLKAKWGGVFRAMAALLGARGGVDIPRTDKKTAYNFLASYYRKFDKPIPDFKDYSDLELIGVFGELSEGTSDIGLSGILNSLQQINV